MMAVRFAAAVAFATLAVGQGHAGRHPVDDSLALLQSWTGPSVDEAESNTRFENQLWQRVARAARGQVRQAWTSRVHMHHSQAILHGPQFEAEGRVSSETQEELQDLRRRLGQVGVGADSTSKRQVLVNYGDVQYVSHFRIGRQTIVGILDTGSFELVVFSKACKSCGSAAKYDPKLSPNHGQGKLMTMQSYGSGDTYSAQAYDLLSIGPYSELNQTFWEVVGARMPILMTSAFEAIIGIGPPETPAVDAWQDAQDVLGNLSSVYMNGSKPSATLLKQAKDSIDAALEVSRNPVMLDNFGMGSFSLCLGSVPGSDGYLVWNDTSAFDKPQLFRRIPVVGKHTWSVSLNNVQLLMPDEEFRDDQAAGHGQPFACQEGCVALMDSGTSLLAVPTGIITWLSREMSQLDADCSNIHKLPDLVFNLGDHRFALPPDAYVAEVRGNVPKYLQHFVRSTELSVGGKGDCQLLLMESYAEGEHGPFWILGMPFFRKYYTTFFIGDSTRGRALYVSPASEDCTPASVAKAALARKKPVKRTIDPSKVHIPNAVQQAYSQRNIAL